MSAFPSMQAPAKTLIFCAKPIILLVYMRFHDRLCRKEKRISGGARALLLHQRPAFSPLKKRGTLLYHIGLDIGSTTIKCVVLDEQQNLLYKTYERHYSHIVEKAAEVLAYAEEQYAKGAAVCLALSGSAGMGFAESCGIPFVQEVYATRIAANRYMPGTDVVIELGGEDAKILFLTNGTEVRMNGSCAGGTGAFIDQMATLLHMTPAER